MQILVNILIGFLILNSILLVLIVLMQRPKNEGLGAAFGGGLTENIFGGQTSNVLTKMTTYLAASFFALSFLIAALYARVDSAKSKTQQELLAAPQPVETPAPPAAQPQTEPQTAEPAAAPAADESSGGNSPQPPAAPEAQAAPAAETPASPSPAAAEPSPAPAESPAPGAPGAEPAAPAAQAAPAQPEASPAP